MFILTKEFPSPCGDMVLKCDIHTMNQQAAGVSVPLRGYGFEILAKERGIDVSEFVSVPLRGYGFEMSLLIVVDAD